MPKKILLLIFIIFCNNAFAQLNNSVFFEQKYDFQDNENKLFLEFQNLNFFRSNEYLEQSSAIGRTLLGYQLSPRLAYYPSKNVKVSLGVFTWRDFGKDDFTEINPYFLLEYQKSDFGLKFGNIKGNLQHNLIEPLYAFENVIEQNLEFGLQLLYQKKHFGADLWIDWQEFTDAGSDKQEEFFVGLNAYINLIKNDKFTFQIPLQATVKHQGGQGLTVNLPVANTSNFATGLKLDWNLGNDSFLKNINFENYFVGFQTDLDLPQKTGQAFYSNLNLGSKYLTLLLSIWLSEDFGSSQRGDLYVADLESRTRNLIFFRLMKNFKIQKDMTITLRVEPFLDLQNSIVEYNFGFYINYQPRFFLAKINQKK